MNINSFDIEAFLDKEYYIPYCVSFYFKNKLYSFYIDKKDIILNSITFIFENIDKNEIFYIHNLKFDGTLIIYNLSKYKQFKINAIIEKKEFYLLEIILNEKKIEFRCSYKLLPLSLQKISLGFIKSHEKIDYPYNFISYKTLFWKDEIPESYFKTKEGYNNYMEILDVEKFTKMYCENDCYITKFFVEKINNIFISKFNIDIIKNNILSTPSLSFHTFYKKFNKKKVMKYIEKEKELYIRDSYFGGRCEVFGNPFINNNIFHFDFPGMYGLCMKEKNVYGESFFKYDINNNDYLEPGFYNIDWYSNINIPILPHHNQINNKLLFCNGEGNGTYWFEEINLFKKYGGKILKINSGLVYKNFDYIFNEFVDYFSKFREIGEEHKVLGKLIINSFYGRTGLSVKENFSFFLNSKEEFDELINLSEVDGLDILEIEEINNIFLITIKLNKISKKILEDKKIYFRKQKILNVAIASSITSKARIKLYEGFKEVENNEGRVLYCDTDSIFAEFNNNVLDRKMGELFWDSKKDDTIIKDCVFIAPKTYGLLLEKKEIIKIKGISRDYINFNLLKEKFFRKEKFIAKNLKMMQYKNFKIKNSEINKEIDLIAYDKRKFLDDLKSTKPFIFNKGEYI